MLNTYHHNLIIVLWLKDLQLLVLEKLKITFASGVIHLVSKNKVKRSNNTYEDLLAKVPGLPPGTSHSVVVSLSAVLQQAPIFYIMKQLFKIINLPRNLNQNISIG
jgi:hypothetical protein